MFLADEAANLQHTHAWSRLPLPNVSTNRRQFSLNGVGAPVLLPYGIRRVVEGVTILSYRFDRGQPHKSTDPKEHLSMELYNGQKTRVTSVHVYADGTGKFSRQKYN